MKTLDLFNPSMNLLSKVLDLRSANQQVISSNIANAETPGYAPARFEFEKELRQAIGQNGFHLVTDNPHHIPSSTKSVDNVTGTVVKVPDKTGIGDKNGVNVDQEMSHLLTLQNSYAANARVMSAVKAMLDALLQI